MGIIRWIFYLFVALPAFAKIHLCKNGENAADQYIVQANNLKKFQQKMTASALIEGHSLQKIGGDNSRTFLIKSSDDQLIQEIENALP